MGNTRIRFVPDTARDSYSSRSSFPRLERIALASGGSCFCMVGSFLREGAKHFVAKL